MWWGEYFSDCRDKLLIIAKYKTLWSAPCSKIWLKLLQTLLKNDVYRSYHSKSYYIVDNLSQNSFSVTFWRKKFDVFFREGLYIVALTNAHKTLIPRLTQMAMPVAMLSRSRIEWFTALYPHDNDNNILVNVKMTVQNTSSYKHLLLNILVNCLIWTFRTTICYVRWSLQAFATRWEHILRLPPELCKFPTGVVQCSFIASAVDGDNT